MLYPDLSKKVLDGVFAVHRALGPGLLEKCYHNALFYELKALGLDVQYNKEFKVHHRGQVVGEYFADIIVENMAVLELKSVERFAPALRCCARLRRDPPRGSDRRRGGPNRRGSAPRDRRARHERHRRAARTGPPSGARSY